MPVPVIAKTTAGPSEGDAPTRVVALSAVTGRLALILAFVTACLSSAQTDTYWLLRAGRDIWQSGTIPRVDTYSFTATGRDWPNHEWLWEVIAFLLHRFGGMPLLTLATASAATASLALARRIAPTSGYAGTLVLLSALAPLSAVWSLRPQVASGLLFAILLTLLARERYALVPALFLVWANLHAGVSAGGVVLGVLLAVSLVVHIVQRGHDSRQRFIKLLVVTATSAVSTLANPLGWGLWSYAMSSGRNPTHDWNTDWISAFSPGPVQVAFWVWLLAILVFAFARRERFRSWGACVVLTSALAAAPLAMVAIRNIEFFLIAAVPSLLFALAPTGPRRRLSAPVDTARTVMATTVLLAAAAIAALWWARPDQLDWRPLSPAAADAVRACPGPVYNSFNAGGYLLWYVPETKVFIDSRVDPYPARFLEQDVRLELTGRYRPLFRRYHIRCAMVRPLSPTAAALAARNWRTEYRDQQWVVFVK